MYQIERVFIGESVPSCTPAQPQIKLETRTSNIVGDIIRFAPNQFKLNCIQCCQTFQQLYEFTLHIEDHFLQNDGFIKDENFTPSDMKFDETIVPVDLISECDLEQNTPSLRSTPYVNDAFDNCLSELFEPAEDLKENDGSHERFVSNKHKCTICGIDCVSQNNLKQHMTAHGKEKNIFCSICMKGFYTVHYVQKHIKSIHKRTTSANEIREAQNTLKQIARPIKSELNSAKQAAREAAAIATVNTSDQISNVKLNVLSSNYWRCEGKSYHCIIELCVKWFTLPKYVQKHIRLVHGRQIPIDEILAAQIRPESQPDQTPTVEIVQQQQNESLQRQQAAADNGKSVKSFECFVCHTMFASLKALNYHVPLHEGIQYACPLCDKYFSMQKYVRDHMIYRHGFDKKSKLPPLKWRKLENFVYHKPKVSRFECYLCHRAYPTRSKLVSHVRTHTEIMNCSICSKIFKSHESRRRHMQLHFADPNRFHHCSICSKTFAVRRYMMSHMRAKHSKSADKVTPAPAEKPSSSSSSALQQQKAQTCAVCLKVFDKVGTFNKHMKCHNKEPARYICDCCGFEFNDSHLLRKHLSTAHKINNKHFKCNLCQKTVPKKREDEHLKWHRGEKEHQCEICGSQYATAGLLNTHKKRQHTEQKFDCDVCFVGFDQPRKLLHHRRTHSEPMEIHCSYCQLGFFNARSLNKHELKKHTDHFDYTFAECYSDSDTDTNKMEV